MTVPPLYPEEVIESPDGDPAKRGTIRSARGMGFQRVRPEPPPRDHPAALLVPKPGDLGDLVIARDLDGIGG